MSSFSSSTISVLAFALTSSIYIGYSNIAAQLRNLKNEVLLCNRRDFAKRLELNDDIPVKKVDLLLEMHSVIAIENVADVVQRVVDVAYNVFRAQRISVMILNRQKTHFTVLASRDVEGKEFSANKGLCSVVLSSGEMINVKDAYRDHRFNPDCDQQTGFHTQSLLCAPLITNNETVGVVYAINKLDDDGEITVFDKQDEDMLEYFSSTASCAIKKSQMYHEAVRNEKNAKALLSIVRSRTADDMLENIFKSTIDAMFQLIFPDCISVYICDQATQKAWVCVSRGGVDDITVDYGQGIAGTVAVNGETVRVANAYDDVRFDDAFDRKSGYKTSSMLCAGVPGFADNSKPVAVIQLLNKLNGKAFTQDDEDSLEILCKELSITLRQKIEELSFMRHSTLSRRSSFNEKEQEHNEQSRLEEAILNEFGAVSQCYKFSAMMSSSFSSDRLSQDFNEINRIQNEKSTPEKNAETQRIINMISKWDFNPFVVSDGDLMHYSFQMIADFDLINILSIDVRKLKNLIMGAHALYHDDVHFHNFKHAWSVMHMSYLILRHGASNYLTPLDILTVLLAALCHDLDHPGTNNGYEIASESELALTYSFDAVLERHHASMTHRLLSSPNSNILDNLTASEQAYVKELITSSILHTNMTSHFVGVERLEIASKMDPPFDVTSAASRRDLVGHVVHTADLSGQVLPIDLAKIWGDRCLAEFVDQAEQEKLNDYPVTEFMACLHTASQRNQAQMGFISNIVLPLWTAMSNCFPSLKLRCSQAQSNHDFYAHCVRLEAACEENNPPA
eukprot:CAMPEP_0114431374 /NCGR_PEP_ID=MMETSP0103-20121206/10567_1 /TAXON_ID=37642 ORGANISM="Paraphysomonas imperforata, Strain PA2" /NCGR_SAMPLE_ID=MMETSP0103 /ASSEMBLY_ACC=CAM_ASM_000201 /LENGTH=791 /DNA_ID=CAMNT_0001600937 /DNA_START=115 /DNA_END=2490 /DNA_ORIENTATION=+